MKKKGASLTEESLSTRILQSLGLTEEEVEELLQELREGDLWEEVIRVVSREVRGDRRGIILTFSVMLSADMPFPANLDLHGRSGEGKTWLVNQIAELFRYGDEHKPFSERKVVRLIGATPKAFIYNYSKLMNEKGELIDDRLAQIDARLEELKGQNTEEAVKERESLKRERQKLLSNAIHVVDLDRKIVTFEERPSDEVLKILRAILSADDPRERVHTYIYVDKDGGRLKTKRIVIRGYPAFIFCRAEGEDFPDWLEDQVRTRFLTISPKVTEEKFREANKVAADLYGLPASIYIKKYALEEKARLAKKIHLLSEILGWFRERAIRAIEKDRGNLPIGAGNFFWVPFNNEIAEQFPRNAGAARDLKRFMVILQATTACRVLRRPILRIGEGYYIISTFEDFYDVLAVYSEVLETALTGLSENIIRFFKELKQEFGVEGEEFQAPDVIKRLDCTRRTAYYYLNRLADIGALDKITVSENPRRYKWRIVKGDLIPPLIDRLREVVGNFTKEDLERALSEIRQYAEEDVEILDQDFIPITVDELWDRYFAGATQKEEIEASNAPSMAEASATECKTAMHGGLSESQAKISPERENRSCATQPPEHNPTQEGVSRTPPPLHNPQKPMSKPRIEKEAQRVVPSGPLHPLHEVDSAQEGGENLSSVMLKCPICGLTFVTQADLEFHMRTHGGRRAKGPDPRLIKARHFAKLAWEIWQERQKGPTEDEELRRVLEELWRVIHPDKEPRKAGIMALFTVLTSAGVEGGLEAIDRWLREKLGEVSG